MFLADLRGVVRGFVVSGPSDDACLRFLGRSSRSAGLEWGFFSRCVSRDLSREYSLYFAADRGGI
jgi:hypothetical protein